jgi:hypothetical protein
MMTRINPQRKAALFVGLLLLIGCLAVWMLAGKWGRGERGMGKFNVRSAGIGAAPHAEEPEDLGCHAPLPPVPYDATYARPTGRTIRVNGGSSAARDLQAALDKAEPGDVVELEAGASFVGNFTLPEKTGDAWVTIRPSAEVNLPSQGVRLTPAAAPSLPRIFTPNSEAAIRTAPRAHNYRLVGIEISVRDGVKQNGGLVLFGDGSGAERPDAQRSPGVVPHDLVLDRCYVHGNQTGELQRGVALNSARSAVIDSYVSACHGVGYDTQAIAGWNGPGPFKIVNNYLEGAGENVMFGGSDPAIPNLVPSDIEFRNNYCVKPLSWKADDPGFAGTHWSVKNLFELKSARRVLVEGNVFDHNWTDAQSGFAILFTVRNQDGGAPWSVVEDVVFSHNVVRGVGAALNLLGRDYLHPSRQLKRVRIEQNLFEDVNGTRWGGNGCFLQMTDAPCVVVDHNSIFQTGNVIASYGSPNTDFVFTNNLTRNNEYGVTGDSVGPGKAALERYFPGAQFTGNLLAGGRRELYPAGNYFPPALDPASAGRAGQPIGADAASLRSRIAKVQAGE